ncbi:MAG TPA: hypothetical protein VF490_09865 [Chryseosolibacter sp.]
MGQILTSFEHVSNDSSKKVNRTRTAGDFNFLLLQADTRKRSDWQFKVTGWPSSINEVQLRSRSDPHQYDFTIDYADSLAFISPAVNVNPEQPFFAELPVKLLLDRANRKLLCFDNSQTAIFLLNEALIPTARINYLENTVSVFEPIPEGLHETAYLNSRLSDLNINDLTLHEIYDLLENTDNLPIINDRIKKPGKPFLLLENIESMP